MTTAGQVSRPAARKNLVEGDLLLSTEDFKAIAAMLHADAGIYLPDSKATLVYSRLAKRLRLLGLGSFRDYCALVAGHEGLDERKQMLVALTTNVTSFFREQHHFDHLRDKVLPTLLQGARQGRRVRIWSAGCSKGHEPYSLAMVVLDLMPDAANHDIRILATDIDTHVLAEANQGLYDQTILSAVPKPERSRYFLPTRDGRSLYVVSEELRALVSFRELNLVGSWPMKGRFDVIFCRNVAIYFDDATQERIWSRFADLLTDGGHLYIGHSERIVGAALQRFTSVATTAYKLGGRGK